LRSEVCCVSCSGKGRADMGSDSQALQQARKLIGQRDFDGAIDLLSPIDDPSPDELFALAEAHFLKATSTEDGRQSKAAYRKAIAIFPECYAECSRARQACREWAYSARVLEDEDELKRAKEAGLAISPDAQLVVIHYFLKLDQDAPPEEREELIDEALRIDPDEPNALSTKASFLVWEGQWKRAYELKRKAINHFSDLQRTHAAFPDLLARTALLALIQGDDWEAYLEWGKDENRRAPWVIVADRIVGMDKKKERAGKAKQVLSGQAEIEGGFDEWLGEPIEMEPDEGEQGDTTERAQSKSGERYRPSSIEQMTPQMREELIVRLLVKGITSISQ
jgi:tetratricopeptide (TPR) repeat protein